jgi:hypothetical protein
MAICKNCGKQVGCGCQLSNGLCGTCQAATQVIKKFKDDVISKAYKLCGML